MENDKEKDIVYSQAIKAGKRIYYLDVKRNKRDELFLSITESKKKVAGEGPDASYTFEKHKIFLYKEDFAKFTAGLQQAIQFIAEQQGLPESHIEEKEIGVDEETESLSESEIKIDIDF